MSGGEQAGGEQNEDQEELELAEAWKAHILANTSKDNLPAPEDVDLDPNIHEPTHYGQFELSEELQRLQLTPFFNGVQYLVFIDHNVLEGDEPLLCYRINFINDGDIAFYLDCDPPSSFSCYPDLYEAFVDAWGIGLEPYRNVLERLKYLQEQGHLIEVGQA